MRGVIALGFILAIGYAQTWLLYLLSALLMIASPFFTSGRSAILPTIANPEELHTANSLTQTTQWTTLTIGAFLGGVSVKLGYEWAFFFNAVSFLFSALCISNLRAGGEGFRAERPEDAKSKVVRPWRSEGQERAFVRFETAPGEQAQMDWGHFGNWNGKRLYALLSL